MFFLERKIIASMILLDLYLQLILKQGQIEMDSQPADLPPDEYRNTDAELINQREVEDLNKSIIVIDAISPSLFQCFAESFRNLLIRKFDKWIRLKVL